MECDAAILLSVSQVPAGHRLVWRRSEPGEPSHSSVLSAQRRDPFNFGHSLGADAEIAKLRSLKRANTTKTLLIIVVNRMLWVSLRDCHLYVALCVRVSPHSSTPCSSPWPWPFPTSP